MEEGGLVCLNEGNTPQSIDINLYGVYRQKRLCLPLFRVAVLRGYRISNSKVRIDEIHSIGRIITSRDVRLHFA